MVVKPFVWNLVWNTVVVLLVGALLPQWWTSPTRDVSTVEIRDKIPDGTKHELQRRPIGDPPAWAAAGRTTRAGLIATSVLLALAYLAVRRDWPRAIIGWTAVAAATVTLVAAIAFVALRPPLGHLSPGFALIASCIAIPLAILAGLVLARAPASRLQKTQRSE